MVNNASCLFTHGVGFSYAGSIIGSPAPLILGTLVDLSFNEWDYGDREQLVLRIFCDLS